MTDQGWVKAGELHDGSKVLNSRKEYEVVESIEYKGYNEIEVYNLIVENYHTFFITELGLMVHNIDCKNATLGQIFKQVGDNISDTKIKGDFEDVIKKLDDIAERNNIEEYIKNFDSRFRGLDPNNLDEIKKIISDTSKDIDNHSSSLFKGTEGVGNPELNRLDYLRNKYDKLTSEQINNRINLRGAVNDEIDRLYKSGISKKELGPAVAGVLDHKTGKYYFGINNIKGKVPTELHPIIKERIDNMPLETYNSYEKWTLGAGSHAEVYALNEAMLANPNAKLEDFMVYVVRSGKKLKPRGLPMPRCPHCEYITDGASYFPEVLKYGK